MQNKKIITLAAAGAIVLAGAGTAAGVTAHNYNVARAAAEREGLTAVTVDYTQPAPSADIGTAAPPATNSGTTTTQAPTKAESSSKSTTATKTTVEQTTKITWTYDADLSKQIAAKLVANFTNAQYDSHLLQRSTRPEYYERIDEVKPHRIMKKGTSSNIALEIYSAWSTKIDNLDNKNFCVEIYRSTDGYYFGVLFISPDY